MILMPLATAALRSRDDFEASVAISNATDHSFCRSLSVELVFFFGARLTALA